VCLRKISKRAFRQWVRLGDLPIDAPIHRGRPLFCFQNKSLRNELSAPVAWRINRRIHARALGSGSGVVRERVAEPANASLLSS